MRCSHYRHPTPATRPKTAFVNGTDPTKPTNVIVTSATIPQSGNTGSQSSGQAVAVVATAPTTSDVAAARIANAVSAPVAGSQIAVNSALKVPPLEVASAIASPPPAPISPVLAASAPQQTGLLNALFGNARRQPSAPVIGAQSVQPIAIATAATAPKAVSAAARASSATTVLPGVDRNRALGVAETEPYDDTDGEPVRVASAAGLARLAPNGIKTQNGGVEVACFKPALIRVLKTVERKFGKPVIVTSGYRSPARNQSANGAKNSLHIYCSAADIRIEGVDRWTLAKYLQSMPGRGGVGTYCHTESVHIDIGPRRDWNWRCRRKK